jgi:hypothetical protein
MLRGAEIAQTRVRFGGETLEKRGREPRFPDACLAREQHDLAFTRFRPFPAAMKSLALFFPPDEGGQAGRVHCVKAALHGTRPQRGPRPRRLGNALEIPSPEVLKLEEIAEKASRAFGDDHHVRLGDALKARREVRRLADDAALLCFARSDQVTYDDQPLREEKEGIPFGGALFAVQESHGGPIV